MVRNSRILFTVAAVILVGACATDNVSEPRVSKAGDAGTDNGKVSQEVPSREERSREDRRLPKPGEPDCLRARMEISAVIDELMTVIADRDYEAWYEHLHESYIEYFSEPEVLEEISEEGVLARRNVQLESLEDYFHHVVVPSRAGKELEGIDFVAPHRVKARTRSNGRQAVLFHLEQSGGDWKISRF